MNDGITFSGYWRGPNTLLHLITVTMKKLKYIGFSNTCFAILFKLMSWQFADKLLITGLGSLGIYFLIKVFKK